MANVKTGITLFSRQEEHLYLLFFHWELLI